MKAELKRIYLQVGEDCPKNVDFAELKGVSWADERINNNDIEYYSKDAMKELILNWEKRKIENARHPEWRTLEQMLDEYLENYDVEKGTSYYDVSDFFIRFYSTKGA